MLNGEQTSPAPATCRFPIHALSICDLPFAMHHSRSKQMKPQPALPHAQYERFESLREYDAMFDELIPSTQRIIRIFEKSLGKAYNSAPRCELLRTFLRADALNRLYIVVHDATSIDRDCPRLVAVLQQF